MGVWSLVCALLAAPPTLLSVRVQGSLEASVVRVEPGHRGAAIAAELARLLRWRGELNRAVHRGDRLDALLGDDAAQAPQQEPALLALRFVGTQITMRAYRFADGDGIERYWDEGGRLIEPRMLNAPVPHYAQITELVQRGGRGRRKHNGIDLKAPAGTPIRLPYAGLVRRINWSQRANGHCIEMAYDSGRTGRFLHLLRLAPQVRPGAHLAADAALGEVGTTGHSNAPHLHYEVWQGSRVLEPLDVHGRSRGALAAELMPAFALQRDAYDRALAGPPATAAPLVSTPPPPAAAPAPPAAAPPPPASGAADCVPLGDGGGKALGCQP